MLNRQKSLPDLFSNSSLPEWLDLPEPRSFRPARKYRTVWISDVHLGTRGCNAAMLLDFLCSIKCETLYLVGDIVDGWRLRKGWYWPDAHNEVVRRILKMAHQGNVNVVTRSAFDYDALHFAGKAGVGFAELGDRREYETSAVLSNRFKAGDGEIGVLLSGSYYERNMITDNFENDWTSVSKDNRAGGESRLWVTESENKL